MILSWYVFRNNHAIASIQCHSVKSISSGSSLCKWTLKQNSEFSFPFFSWPSANCINCDQGKTITLDLMYYREVLTMVGVLSA